MYDYFTYDAAGRLTKVACATNISATYNAGSELTTETTGSAVTTFGYDAEGDRTSMTPPTGTASSYTYDQEERLTGVSGPTTASYVYNGDGLRMSKTVNGTVTAYDWDQSGSLPLLIEAGATGFIYGPGGLTLEQISGSTADYFLHNWQGSTLGLVSSSGSHVASYAYNDLGTLTSSSGSVSTPLLFQGQYLDAETGFYYLQARYYDPSTGQFLTTDPLNALVPYQYTLGDPVNASDPSGEMITRGTIGSGVSGPTAVAPPPATDQAAYYHQISQETAAPPPVPAAPPQVVESTPSAAISAPSVSKATGCSGFCPGQWALAGAEGFAAFGGTVFGDPEPPPASSLKRLQPRVIDQMEEQGYNAEALKADAVGRSQVSRFNLYYDPETGSVYAVRGSTVVDTEMRLAEDGFGLEPAPPDLLPFDIPPEIP
jgi:RHS repeat-associated protein